MDFVIWYLSGLVISYAAYMSILIEFEDYRCPTPRAILGLFLLALAGPVMLVPAAIVCWACLVLNRPGQRNWWSEPVCRKKK